jgi:RNA polymerase primary sigma factor
MVDSSIDPAGISRTGTSGSSSQNKIGTYNKANKAYMAFEQEHEREPSTEELAELLEMSETEINNIFQSNTRHTSSMPRCTKRKMWPWATCSKGSDDTDDDVMKDSLRNEIRRVLKSLSPREAEIVNAYFGLDGENGLRSNRSDRNMT